jgi:asparagine synthase (glutamine-hydrolysing)
MFDFTEPTRHGCPDGRPDPIAAPMARKKSLLRAAVADLLPRSVTERVKAPYPATHDPAYDIAIRAQAADLLSSPNAPVWTYLDPGRLSERLERPDTDRATRAGIDFALNLDLWLTR